VSLEKRALVAQVLADNGISHAVFIADLQARVEESRHWLAKSNRQVPPKTGALFTSCPAGTKNC